MKKRFFITHIEFEIHTILKKMNSSITPLCRGPFGNISKNFEKNDELSKFIAVLLESTVIHSTAVTPLSNSMSLSDLAY